MYRDGNGKKWKLILAAAAIVVCAVLVWVFIQMSPAAGDDENTAESIKTAVQQSALQCYVVEGAYPPSLQYLQDNYGLRINTRDYYVTYDAYAENQLPDVRVTIKKRRDR